MVQKLLIYFPLNINLFVTEKISIITFPCFDLPIAANPVFDI